MVKLVKGKMTEQLFFNILFSKERMNERKEEKKLLRSKKLDKFHTTVYLLFTTEV